MDSGIGRADGSAIESEMERELRRRLAFYEGFDAIISENIRRSGELLREAEQQQAAARVAAEGDRRRQRQVLGDLGTELSELSSRIEALGTRVQAALRDLDPAGPLTASDSSGASSPAGRVPDPQPVVDDTLFPSGTSEVIIHGVTDLATAQALRLRLSGIHSVVNAEPREFGAGLLRMTVQSTEPLRLADFSRALAPMQLTVSDRGPGVVALLLQPDSRQ